MTPAKVIKRLLDSVTDAEFDDGYASVDTRAAGPSTLHVKVYLPDDVTRTFTLAITEN